MVMDIFEQKWVTPEAAKAFVHGGCPYCEQIIGFSTRLTEAGIEHAVLAQPDTRDVIAVGPKEAMDE